MPLVARGPRPAIFATRKTLTITAAPVFTAKWLSPQLFALAEAHPGYELRFVASLKILDFDRDGIDLAIRFGQGDDGDLATLPFLENCLTPMMAPGLVARHGTLDGLRDATLLHDESIDFVRPVVNWATWLRTVGLDRDADHGPRFSQGDHALDAAMAGGGVVLGRVALATQSLLAGVLVAPFRTAIAPDARFRIVHQKGAENRPHRRAFIDWLVNEVRATDGLRTTLDIVPPVEA